MTAEARGAPLSVGDLRSRVGSDQVDTVLVVITDMQGRLQGKRIDAHHFLSDVLTQGTEACNYLLAVDVDMNTVAGYEMSSWQHGYGDFVLVPDLTTLRMAPWLPATAMVQCDLLALDGTPVAQSPRQILRRQSDAAAALGYDVVAATELEFMVFEDTYEAAWDGGYRALTPANRYNVDYSILGTSKVEPLLRDIRRQMHAAGLVVESAKGECNLGQHEIAFKYADAVRTADQHSVFKTAAKEIAAAHGRSLTFMAKYDAREGNSCHIHMSLRGTDGSMVFDSAASSEAHPSHAAHRASRTPVFTSFVAGILTTLAEFTLLYAPTINSYKRFAEGSFAPTSIAWGEDNRTCALRVIGHGASLRVENRVPGGDVNPYLALAAMLAAGLHGVAEGLVLEPALEGNAYTADRPQVPATLAQARDRFAGSALARRLFGDDVVDHYVHAADIELAAFNSAVTDWERVRGFERL